MAVIAVDLFCGVGGLTCGLRKAGINVVAGIDLDSTCRYAYESNNHATFIAKNIAEVKGTEIDNFFGKDDVKVLVGCAPCQPFSKYTQRYRKQGRKDDKWKLLYEFERLIAEVQPVVVSMENVPELINEVVFDDFVEALKKMGYYVSYSIVYCPDYQVPQIRKRLVLLASKLGSIQIIPPILKPQKYISVRKAIGKLPALLDGEVDAKDSIHCCSKLSEKNRKRIRASIPGGTWKDWSDELKLDCHIRETGKGYGAVYGRMLWDEPSPTITTQFFGYGNGRFGHPEQDRALSFREGAILQSFPKNYKFIKKGEKINRKELGIHIGNAVPVKLGEAIGITILQHIELYKNSLGEKR